MIPVSNNSPKIYELKRELSNEFEMKDSGALNTILDIVICSSY